MKTTLIIALFCISYSFGQTTTTIVNQKSYGGDLSDAITDLIKLNNGTYIISGYSESGVTGNKTNVNYGFNDYWVININQDFTSNWQINLGGLYEDFTQKAVATSDGGFLIGGYSNSPISGNKTSPNNGAFDYWLIKINDAGIVEWEKSYGGSGDDYLTSIESFNDGNILLFGNSNSPISGDKTEASRGGNDYWLLKVSSSGNIIWDKTVGGNATETSNDAIIDYYQNIYLTGSSQSNSSGEKTENNYGNQNCWVVKLDSSGTIKWDKTLGGNDTESVPNIEIMAGYIYLTSSTNSPVSGTKTADNNGVRDYWLVKMDTLIGNILWDKTYGGYSSQDCASTLHLFGHQLLMCGNSLSDISGTKTEPNIGSTDMWAVLVDSSGTEIWQKTIGGTQLDFLQSVYRISNNHFIFSGRSWSDVSGDKNHNSYGGSDIWLLELTTNLGINSQLTSQNINLYPNPSNGLFTLNNVPKNANITIYNLQGKVIKKTINSQAINNYKINLTGIKTGIYFVNIATNTSKQTFKLIIK